MTNNVINSGNILQQIKINVICNEDNLELENVDFDNDEDKKEIIDTLIYEENTHDDDKTCFINRIKLKSYDLNKISSLTLSSCGLSMIPDCFEALRIKKLDISYNYLTDVPSCLINGLKNVEHLNISNNLLKHFDLILRCINRITVINLEHNAITNFPMWILSSKCINLQSFTFSYNKITSDIPFANNKIQIMKVNNCQLIQDDLKSFKMFPLLQALYLGNLNGTKKNENCVGNIDYLFIRPLWQKSIKILDLQYLNISILTEELQYLSNLKELYLQGNRLSWLPDSFVNLKNLEVLNVSNNTITYLPQDFFKLNLKTLIISNNSISYLPKLNDTLIILDLYSNYIEEIFDDVKNVKYIDVEENYCNGDKIFGYVDKRNSLRLMFNLKSRSDGRRIESCDDLSESSSSLTDDDMFDNDINVNYYCEIEHVDEIWNVERTKGGDNDVTMSDDEWTGSFKVLRRNAIKRSNVGFNYEYEKYLFVDVD